MGKFYAVVKGLSNEPKIYDNWAQCQKEISGVKGVIYKSFTNIKDAENFIDMQNNNCKTLEMADSSLLTIYVDGSYKDSYKNYSYGLVAVLNDEVVYEENGVGDKSGEAVALRNISGEVMGAMKAVLYATENGYSEINLCYDYQGIECWALGTWNRNVTMTKDYHKFMTEKLQKIKINFIKIKGHSGVKFNERADELAKQALMNIN